MVLGQAVGNAVGGELAAWQSGAWRLLAGS